MLTSRVSAETVTYGNLTEEGGHNLHAAKNDFSETSVFKLILALRKWYIVRNNCDKRNIVQVERRLCLSEKCIIGILSQTKHVISLKIIILSP